jgi:ethanolamine utilization protein EutN
VILGNVVGNVWATRKDENLKSFKLLVVKPIKFNKDKDTDVFVAVDSVGAGIGDTVLVSKGSAARVSLSEDGHGSPVDATIVAIIDEIDIKEEVNYK